MAGWTIVAFLKAFFGVEKIDEECERQKDEKEGNVEVLPSPNLTFAFNRDNFRCLSLVTERPLPPESDWQYVAHQWPE